MQNNDYLTLYYLANETKMKRTLPKWARDEQYDQIDEFCREMYTEKRKRRKQKDWKGAIITWVQTRYQSMHLSGSRIISIRESQLKK